MWLLCSKVKGADAQEKVVYGIIEEAGNKGIRLLVRQVIFNK